MAPMRVFQILVVCRGRNDFTGLLMFERVGDQSHYCIAMVVLSGSHPHEAEERVLVTDPSIAHPRLLALVRLAGP
jgi:hypothetical protein